MKDDLVSRLRDAGPTCARGTVIAIPDGWYEPALGFVRAVECAPGRHRISRIVKAKGQLVASFKMGTRASQQVRDALWHATLESRCTCMVCGEAAWPIGGFCGRHAT